MTNSAGGDVRTGREGERGVLGFWEKYPKGVAAEHTGQLQENVLIFNTFPGALSIRKKAGC